MDFQFYLFCFVAGLLGIIAHVLFIKIPQLRASAKVGNTSFSVSDYFKNDWLTFVTSIFTIVVAMFVLDEIVKQYPIIANWVKWFFIFIGYTGSSILQQLLNKTADKINQTIDTKTDIADGKTAAK